MFERALIAGRAIASLAFNPMCFLDVVSTSVTLPYDPQWFVHGACLVRRRNLAHRISTVR